MWKCPKCKAEWEDSFDSCWSCGIGRDGMPPDAAPASARPTRPESEETLDIAGTKNRSEKVAARLIGAVACVGLGTYFLLHVETYWSAETGYIVAVISFIIAALLPYNEHAYVDFTARQILTLKHYCGFEISKRCRPLTDFDTIVVRHLCHPGGEGPDTYTGSVGLKPVDGRAVLWLKEFPTTQDKIPREAYEFAIALQTRLRLPMTVLGLEFLDLEKSRCLLPNGGNASGTQDQTNPSHSTVSETDLDSFTDGKHR